MGAPVYVDDEVYGTFCFYDTEPRDGQFSEWEVTLVDLLSQWVSYELQRERFTDRLQRQNDRLERFASIVSHDLRNPLNVVSGSIDLADETGDLAQLSRARRAVDRMDTLIEDLLLLARSGDVIDETERVDLGALAADCWQTVPTNDAMLSVGAERTVQADRRRLQQLLENLFRNAVEHGSTSPPSKTREDAVEHSSTSPRSHAREDAVEHEADTAQHGGRSLTITVGDLPNGFYVEDDGTGVPEEIRADVFESGYTTIEDGTGFGLAIVSEIVDAHDWEITVTESDDGGARFEITDG
ncbi:Signal transduction histidine kinase [Halopenitus malekzadehii]|uniref:histidine kinase n=1 Tax=Halopenitus malekzadehii TaxID=1267564 RepID=A0A1H6JRY2_9EURY|nr:HAMP domain-containing sensor histidine kinase [Halopenitus malekzadehii]SEH62667.1 Signal transduction histidine kinase [Halopenitus malekzadehii]